MKHVVIAAVVVGASLVGCARPPPAPPGLPSIACLVDDDPAAVTLALNAEVLARIPPPSIELFLGEDSGGPLRCRPSNEACAAFAGCVGAPVPVPIGAEAVLAVGVRRAVEETAVTVVFDEIALAPGSEPAFTVLEPAPQDFTIAEREVLVLVVVTPSIEGVISADLLIQSDARNMPDTGEAVSVTLQVEGIQP